MILHVHNVVSEILCTYTPFLNSPAKVSVPYNRKTSDLIVLKKRQKKDKTERGKETSSDTE